MIGFMMNVLRILLRIRIRLLRLLLLLLAWRA